MTECVIFDIDWTLADVSHRRHHVAKKPKNWAAWNAGMGNDMPNEPIAKLARILHAAGNTLVLCTGREEDYRRLTEAWLTLHGIQFSALYMRPSKDYRADHIVKLELLEQIRANGYSPWLVVEDRASVTKMWRDAGLACLQCAEGDF